MYWVSVNSIITIDGWISSSEKLIRIQAQQMVQGGYLAAGYQYIIIDDCWLNHTRGAVNFLPILMHI